MAFVNPITQRHYSDITENGLLITIPARKNWFMIPFLGIWLVGWAFGEVMVGGIIVGGLFGKGFNGAPVLFMLVWFTFWTIGGAFAIYAFFWQLMGKEEIEITKSSLTISQIIAQVKRSKKYNANHIKDLRISPMGINEMHGWSRPMAVYGIGGGVIVFDYGAGTIRFGNGIDEAEGKQIIAEIQKRYPQYQENNK